MYSSLYPQRAKGSHIVVSSSSNNPSNISVVDRLLVSLSSLAFVGSVFWVPALYLWAWKRWKRIPQHQTRRRALYGAFLVALTGIGIVGPYRRQKVGAWFNVRRWKLWKAWINFLAYEVIYDFQHSNGKIDNHIETEVLKKSSDWTTEQVILAIIPHGIFPFSLAFAALPQLAVEAFGIFRPVVATATGLIPLVRTLISWIHGVDASRLSVDRALLEGHRIGLAPGGIAEMFVGHSRDPDEEFALLTSRKGFIRLAIKHGLPVVPVYCFGASKMLRRLPMPSFIERLSVSMRASLCLFFGQWGLPIPFRQRLMYVVGRPIYPSSLNTDVTEGSPDFDRIVDEMHKKFCDALVDLFDRYKELYGWKEKVLKII